MDQARAGTGLQSCLHDHAPTGTPSQVVRKAFPCRPTPTHVCRRARVHCGCTSQDAIDTAMALVTRDALALVVADVDKVPS